MEAKVNVNEWVAMFRDIGLDDATMHQWHHLFEMRHPEAHQHFLEWLGLPANDIEGIRTKSR